MADCPDDDLKRLLRDLQADLAEVGRRLTRVERRQDEVLALSAKAMGHAVMAERVVEGHGQHFDALREDISVIRQRLSVLGAL
jgi:carbon monoxide dehydrogenase subunit G